jgi:hypothetical protein
MEGPYREVIPGWFDTQLLAIPNAAGDLVPGPLGTIKPVGMLDELPPYAWESPTEVARIEIRGDSAEVGHYQDKLNVELTDQHRGFFVGYVSVQFDFAMNSWSGTFLGDNGLGSSRPDKPSPRVAYLDFNHAAAGAVRWRWSDQDEEIWVYCRWGCCYVED